METIKLDLIPGKKMPSLHASQYDDGREHGIDLFENGVVYKLDGTETLTINERKGDDCICSLDIENTFADSNHIVFASTEQMCAVWGNNICELVIAKGEKTIGTLNFILEIEQSPTEGGIESESEIKNLERQVEAITEEVIGDNYYTKTQTDSLLNAKANTSSVYTKTQVDTKLNAKANVNDVYTKTQVESRLSAKANTSDVYTKSQTDNLLNDKADVTDLPDMSQYYTKSEEDALLANKADKSDTYTKAQVDDIIYGILPDDTASGSVANFETDLVMPLKSLEIDVNAVQESGVPTPASPLPISGWSKISPVKAGKNLLSPTLYKGLAYNPAIGTTVNLTESSKQLTDNQDGTFSITTTNNWETFCMIVPIKSKSYYRKTVISSNGALGTSEVWLDKNLKVISTYNNIDTTQTKNGLLTIPVNASYFAWAITNRSVANSTLTITQPQIEIGSVATAYESYVGNEYIINLGGTYYGGHFTQDKNGHRQFEVTHNIVDLGSLNWVVGATDVSTTYRMQTSELANVIKKTASSTQVATWVKCEAYETKDLNSVYLKNMGIAVASSGNVAVYDSNYNTASSSAAFKQSVQGVMFVYELENPTQIIDLPDGEPIITLNGTNNIYADTGDSAVEYKCSVAEYVANHSGGGGAKSLGGVFLGGSNSGSEEEPTEEEPKEVTKTLGDEPISKK